MGFLDQSDFKRWKNCYQILYFIAVVNLLLGVLSVFIKDALLSSIGGPYLLIAGILFSVLAIVVHRKKNVIAVWIALTYWAVEIVLSVYSIFYLQKDILIGGLVTKCLLLFYISRGLGATKRLKTEIQS
jgi:uncharacterized membrane protein HdeD (DUF308 family)